MNCKKFFACKYIILRNLILLIINSLPPSIYRIEGLSYIPIFVLEFPNIGLGLYQMYQGDRPMQDSLFSQDDHKKRNLDRVIHKLGSKGMNLVKKCSTELEEVEKKVLALSDDGEVTEFE